MAYNQQLADRVRERFEHLSPVEEKEMMGGLCMMYNGKMCLGVLQDELMCRIDPDEIPQALERRDCRQMEMSGRTMKGYVLVDETGLSTQRDFNYWIDLCLAFNPRAKASKKK